MERRSTAPNIDLQRGSAPLAGIRIITVDNFFAGNYGPLLLAMHGAEVVKVELPGLGDALRRDAPYFNFAGREMSHGELRLLRGKASVALDLKSKEGRRALDSLVSGADVFWTNLRPTAQQSLRIDYAPICAVNPRIVFASLSGFGLYSGDDAGDSGVPAFDIVIQALTGLMSRNADPDGTPQYSGIAIADQVTSLYAAMGVILALYQRTVTGLGQSVDVAMFDSMVALNEKTLSLYSLDGVIRPPRISATNSPFGAYRASDGYVVIGVGANSVWKRFCQAIGRPQLGESSDLDTGVKRVAAEVSLIRPLVEAWLSDKTVNEAVVALLECDVPAGPVHEVDRVLCSTRARSRGVISGVNLGGDEAVSLIQSPILLSGSRSGCSDPPHELGADTERILRDWGRLTVGEVADLRNSGAIV